jgi:hypothetical protein
MLIKSDEKHPDQHLYCKIGPNEIENNSLNLPMILANHFS